MNKSQPKSRGQVITPRARKIPNPRREPPRRINIGEIFGSVLAFAKPIAIVLVVIGLIVGYNVVASSRAFLLRQVSVADAAPSLRDEVEQTVRRVVGQNPLLETELSLIRQKVEQIPRVRSATVGRILPDGIFVRVVERQPVVLVRRESGAREGKLVWLDDEAVEIGEFLELKVEAGPDGQTVPPVAKGFAEGLRSQALVAEDRDRVSVYRQLQREFSQGSSPLWNLIDQVDLTFTKDVNLHLAHPSVMIHVGSMDFRKRFERALQVLRSLQQGDSELPNKYRVQDVDRLIKNASNVNFIDAARSERIVVNFASPGGKKQAKQEQNKK
jgi:hypothetical protein